MASNVWLFKESSTDSDFEKQQVNYRLGCSAIRGLTLQYFTNLILLERRS